MAAKFGIQLKGDTSVSSCMRFGWPFSTTRTVLQQHGRSASTTRPVLLNNTAGLPQQLGRSFFNNTAGPPQQHGRSFFNKQMVGPAQQHGRSSSTTRPVLLNNTAGPSLQQLSRSSSTTQPVHLSKTAGPPPALVNNPACPPQYGRSSSTTRPALLNNTAETGRVSAP